MRLGRKTLITILYLFFMLLVASQTLAAVPVNERTLPTLTILFSVLVAGLALVLGWDYIIPMVVRNYKLGECRVIDERYIVCRYRRVKFEWVGYGFVKVIPVQSIADMDRDARLTYMQSLQGLLAGSQYEPIVCWIGMRDRYRETVVEKLRRRMNMLMALSRRETLAVRDAIERIRTELRILQQTAVILEGFYIAGVREYGDSVEEVVQRVESSLRSLQGTLSAMGVKAEVIKGQELMDIVEYMLFGSVVQLSK